jgi:glutamine synthetase
MSTPTIRSRSADAAQEDPAVIERLRRLGVNVVRLSYSDIHGVPRGKDVPLAEFPHVLADGMGVCAANLADGLNFSLANLAERVAASPEANEASPTAVFPDMRVRVIPESLVQLPWERSTAWCLASVDGTDAQAPCSTRNVLESIVEEYQALGLAPVCAPELRIPRQSRGV